MVLCQPTYCYGQCQQASIAPLASAGFSVPTCSGDLDNGIVWVFDLWSGHLANADLEGFLVVDGFHGGGGGSRHGGKCEDSGKHQLDCKH